mmetsp:Transcript_21846/g.45461  ORF Transcript_21846/g.45461 Transcript_21846/m.45461 type:complete len:240 (+) Transcript_21846:136-855(+)
MTGRGNEEWGDFSSTLNTRDQLDARGRLDGSLATFVSPQPLGRNGGLGVNNIALSGNALPGIFGAYQQRRGSSGNFVHSTRVRSSATRNGLTVPIPSCKLTLERKKQSEIDTRTLDAEALEKLERNDPFLYHSIPAVSNSSRFWDEIDLKEVQQPSRNTMKRSMDSCPAKMAAFNSSGTSVADRSELTTVKRRTRISHEVHSSLLAIDDDTDGSDDDSESDDDDDIVGTLLRVMSKATV